MQCYHYHVNRVVNPFVPVVPFEGTVLDLVIPFDARDPHINEELIMKGLFKGFEMSPQS